MPDDLLTCVLGHVSLEDLRATSCADRLTNRDQLWYSMAAKHGVQLPQPSSRFATRASKRDLRCSFWTAVAAQLVQRTLLADKLVWDLWLKLHKSDAAAAVHKALKSHPWLDVNHRLQFYHGSSLLHLAARRGRLRCVRLLVEQHGADADALDGGNFTPLSMAAWSNRKAVVMFLLRSCNADTRPRGTPPMTSSCGGRGPHTAEEWAARKGFDDIARAIGAARTTGRCARA